MKVCKTKDLYYYILAAESGDVEAQKILGDIYSGEYKEINIEKADKESYKQAFSWYLKATEAGNVVAKLRVAWLYRAGIGIKKDDKKALYWFKKAAEEGNAKAQIELGDAYLHGFLNVPKDEDKAFKYYKMAADQGDPEGLCELGDMYYIGESVSENKSRALEYYILAAEQDYPDAFYHIGNVHYSEGHYTKAQNFYEDAIRKGSTSGKANLAFMHLAGLGSAGDFGRAKELIESNIKDHGCDDYTELEELKLDTMKMLSCIFTAYITDTEDDESDIFARYAPGGGCIDDERKINAKKTFLKYFDEDEDILLYYDESANLSGKTGFAIGKKVIAWKNLWGKPNRENLTWKGLANIRCKDSDLIMNDGAQEYSVSINFATERQRETVANLIRLFHEIALMELK